jgi:hypothetical protein
VADASHLHQQLCVVDGVHDSVVAYPDAPLAIAALQFLTAYRTRIIRKIIESRHDPRQSVAQGVF